jgi:hypothetical protein
MRGTVFFLPFLLPFLLSTWLVEAAEKQATTTSYRRVLAELVPGDTLILEAGVYERGLPLSDCKGQPGAWITIQGPEIGTAEIRQSASANCVELWQCQYVALKKLTLQGSGVSGQFGISAKGGLANLVHDILVEDCVISDFNTSQQAVGISTKTPTWNWTIRRNIIRRCGTGLYLGNSNGAEPFVQGVIEHNLVHDPIGYCMEIKFQKSRPDLPGLPTAAGSTIIRHNVFIKNDQPSPDGDRPNVLVGGFPDSGPGSADLYEIYGNFFYHNPRESLLHASGRVSIHDNVFADCPHPEYAAVLLRKHDLPLKLAHVFHNTIVAAGRGICIASDPVEGQAVTGNVVFAGVPVVLPGKMKGGADNLTGAFADAVNYLAAPDAALGALDLHPKPGQCVGVPIDLSAFAGQADVELDFDGLVKPRDGTHRGAYTGVPKSKAWRLGQSLKGSE